ncbi:alanyl-tRNA synthetase [Ruminiclostridium sufflavum DSM 19573]|uniref:Alanine--tRNA ligase n=1 Tax=Ruminiclostridium sufflavum DSM 19573 TaxID=1121337 RepID=A0A318XQ55_9FIRM|nr:alanine--tRNA ligase [Ruminiclostridium sufflavum]PYG90205.1 alanyl-tRNA synthetase [Ruminiclostridium sufflavum DSM 19573]
MYTITSDEIRTIFLEYFQKHNHKKIAESSVIPENDPTLLFINSGMAPLKNYFTGEEVPPASNLCNIQPCIRTIDIDEIGDRHHLTSFEMLGSWSFNNYFKEDAIKLAFELLTEGLKIPKEKLYATVFMGSKELNLEPDTESIEIWQKAGMDRSHIVPQPFEDNFWGPTAETGPCGPCTEVFYDTGEEYGEAYTEGGEFDTRKRYIEIWNAGVFMQLNKMSDGTYEPLKFKSVDTGAGLERLTMTLNKLNSVYEIDSLRPIVDIIKNQCTSLSPESDIPESKINILSDHLRTVTILLAAGAVPGNAGRGYIPRKLIRKCCTILAKYKVDNFNYKEVINKIIEHYNKYYGHFEKNRNQIFSVFNKEVEGYSAVLEEGTARIEKMCGGLTAISGKDAFVLVTSYGLPFDFIQEYAAEHGMTIDKEEYDNEIKHHKEISKIGLNEEGGNGSSLPALKGLAENFAKTGFTGYEELSCKAHIIGIIKDNAEAELAAANEQAIIITDKSCFYAESGGQIADTGTISAGNMQLEVTDVKKAEEVFFHFAKVISGEVRVDQAVDMIVDSERRTKIEANHSAVHLLQKALRIYLGESVKQAGSLVTDDRLRFDFQCDKKLEADVLDLIEATVNEYIRRDYVREVQETSYEQAVKEGALAFFSNKYSDVVRMVSFGEVSKELCGGTHIASTGKIGFCKIISEESAGRGIRRIVALTGSEAVRYVQEEIKLLNEIAAKLKTGKKQILSKLDTLGTKKEQPEEAAFTVMTKEQTAKSTLQSSKGTAYITREYPAMTDEVRDEAIRVAELIRGVVCFYSIVDDKVQITIAIDKELSKSCNANGVIKSALAYLDGKGGGSAYLARGSGNNAGGLKDMLEGFKTLF